MEWGSRHLGKGCRKLLAVPHEIVLERLFEIDLLGNNILMSCFFLVSTDVEKNVPPVYGTNILKVKPPLLFN